MRTTGIFEIHSFEMVVPKLNQPIYFFPFGDVHKFAPLHAGKRWQETLDWAKGKRDAYWMGMGDYTDIGSTSERKILNHTDLHDGSARTLNGLYENQTQEFARDIEFMRGRLVGMIEGNHYGLFTSGITTTQRLCQIMDCKYLGVNALVRLRLKIASGNRSYNRCVDVFVHHGRGGGRTVGGSMNPVEQMTRNADADIYLMGDNHRKGVDYASRLCLAHNGTDLKLVDRKIILARTGTFLKGYIPGEVSYIADAAYSPSDLGLVKIEITIKRRWEDGSPHTSVDLSASEVEDEELTVDLHASC